VKIGQGLFRRRTYLRNHSAVPPPAKPGVASKGYKSVHARVTLLVANQVIGTNASKTSV